MVHYVILGKRLVKGPCHEIIDVGSNMLEMQLRHGLLCLAQFVFCVIRPVLHHNYHSWMLFVLV